MLFPSLTPSSLTYTNKDYNSLTSHVNAVFKREGIFIPNSATNTPTITIGSGSRTISHMFLDDDPTADDLGIRVSGSSLAYSTGASSAWMGSGLLDKPIDDFHAGTHTNLVSSFLTSQDPWFAASSGGSVRIGVNSQIIPEPQEYALVFSLFALGFVFLHRRMMQKKRQQ